jgi:hypothetical protein
VGGKAGKREREREKNPRDANSENEQVINLSLHICKNIQMKIGILSHQVTSRSQKLNPYSCSMCPECWCDSEFDVTSSEVKES